MLAMTSQYVIDGCTRHQLQHKRYGQAKVVWFSGSVRQGGSVPKKDKNESWRALA